VDPHSDAHPEHDEPPAVPHEETAVGAVAGATAAAGGDLVHQASLWGDAWRQLRRNPVFLVSITLIAVLAVMAVFPGLFTREDPFACSLSRSLDTPSSEHVFGFDIQGCNYYARVIHGARVSMQIGLSTVVIAVAIAVVLGSLAGYYGGRLDTLISRLTDIWFGLPPLLAALVFLAVMGERGLTQVTLVLALFGWPTMLRLMRSSVIEMRERDYVQAARALGASDRRIITRHILPNAVAPVIIYGTIFVGIAIAAEATLTYLGVGLTLPNISWGLMLNDAQNRVRNAPHLLVFPGLFLSVTVLAFIMLGDALRDALDPRLR
jgi:oligopeptide transport system permease protein